MKASTALRQARRRAGLTQRQLAERTGLPQSTVGRIEAELVDPRVSTLDTLLRACGDELDAVARRGVGVDRSLIQANLDLDLHERLEQASVDGDWVELVRDARAVEG